MTTSATSKPKFHRAFVPTTALAKSVEFDDDAMHVRFTDGRVLSVPLAWFPGLQGASREQLERCEIAGGGISIHWPEWDENISVAGLMAGVDQRSM